MSIEDFKTTFVIFIIFINFVLLSNELNNDGYKGIAWGTDKQSVLKILNLNALDDAESTDRLLNAVENGDIVEVYFFENRAYKVVYLIKSGMGEFDINNNTCPEQLLSLKILDGMKKKYGKKYITGKYEKKDEMGFSTGENPYTTYTWSNKETIIELRIPVILCTGYAMEVVYLSKKISNEMYNKKKILDLKAKKEMDDKAKEKSDSLMDNL